METEGKPQPLGYFTPAMTDLRYDKPDWATLTEDIFCPLCQYNLRGLTNPLCPECGYQFQWPELLDPARRCHSYLFEHHPEKSFRSFWQTAFHGLRPIKFWKSLRADHECVPGRLRLYWMFVALVFVVGFASNVGVLELDYAVLQSGTLMPLTVGGNGSTFVTSFSASAGFTTALNLSPFIVIALIVLAWPFLTIASLHLLSISMRQAQVRSVHILRCVAYSWDIVLWGSVITIITNVVESALIVITHSQNANVAYYTTPYWGLAIPLTAWYLAVPVFIFRMCVAYRSYLRFRHPIWVVLLTQFLVAMLVLAVFLQAITYRL